MLRVLEKAVSVPKVVWKDVYADMTISESTFREAAVAFAGDVPSKLDLTRHPGAIAARVCARALPTQLLEWKT